MAVNIDTVYQRVLAIANKEQRGYVTPQEFNLFARKAQLEIFENYFNELDFFLKRPGSNDTVHADDIDSIREKIDRFEVFDQYLVPDPVTVQHTLPSYYRMGKIYYNNAAIYLQVNGAVSNSATITFDDPNADNGIYNSSKGLSVIKSSNGQDLGVIVSQTGSSITISQNTTLEDDEYVTIMPHRNHKPIEFKEVELIPQNRLHYYTGSDKLRPSTKFPICVKSTTNSKIKIYPQSITQGVVCNYIKRPSDPKWTYVVVNGKALYNASDAGHQDFELHISEEGTLVNKILELAGISLMKPGLSEIVLRNEQMKQASKNQ